MNAEYVRALLGGMAIGAAGGLFYLLNGKIMGVSGILGGLFTERPHRNGWRVTFVVVLLVVGGIGNWASPDSFGSLLRTNTAVMFSGLLVGLGTRVGNGCTSGHGVCGIGRFSIRSLVATVTFILFGMVTVAWVNAFAEGVI